MSDIRISEEYVCNLLLQNIDNNIFFIKTDYRLEEYYEEDSGKLASEVYPYHHDVIRNINNFIKEILYPRNSKIYQDYFQEHNKIFIKEVWKREKNTMKLIYYRSDENSDFIDLAKAFY